MKKTIILMIVVFVCGIIGTATSSAQLLNTVVALTGNVFDAVTREPVTAFITVKDENGDKISATRSNAYEKGYYYVTGLKPGRKYTILLNKPDYFKEKFELTVANTDKYVEISKDFLMKPLVKGVQIPFVVPPFELNKTKLRFGGEELLDDIKNSLTNNTNIKFQILCYPDKADDQYENEKITLERCKAIMAYFVANGVDASRITMLGSGKPDPKNPPPTKTKAKGKKYIGPSYIVVTDF
jgi:outer membrane protein OmpA-like peptidoglycan-associated protein